VGTRPSDRCGRRGPVRSWAALVSVSISISISILAGSGGCERSQGPDLEDPKGARTESLARPECRVVFDAGSSETRMHLYVREEGGGWVSRAERQGLAMADPVLERGGKTWTDAEAVVDELGGMFADVAADWSGRCTLRSISVLATGGMRLAAQHSAPRSAQLHRRVCAALREEATQTRAAQPSRPSLWASEPRVESRTLTGVEEGVYAWLAVATTRGRRDFGLVEMGGASVQIVFPCPGCADARAVRLYGSSGVPGGSGSGRGEPEVLELYAHSFLGLGTSEAAGNVGTGPACAYGAGEQPGPDGRAWSPEDCRRNMVIIDDAGLLDPRGPSGSANSVRVPVPLSDAAVVQGEWALAGAFAYADPSDIGTCCESRGDCYDTENACFRAVYQPALLDALGIAGRAESLSWTAGAVACIADDCLN